MDFRENFRGFSAYPFCGDLAQLPPLKRGAPVIGKVRRVLQINIDIQAACEILVIWILYCLFYISIYIYIHPGRLTWNLQSTHLERKMIFQASMIMFHVNLPECICRYFTSCYFQYTYIYKYIRILSIWKGYILGCYQLLEFENLKDLSDPTLELFFNFQVEKGTKMTFGRCLWIIYGPTGLSN